MRRRSLILPIPGGGHGQLFPWSTPHQRRGLLDGQPGTESHRSGAVLSCCCGFLCDSERSEERVSALLTALRCARIFPKTVRKHEDHPIGRRLAEIECQC